MLMNLDSIKLDKCIKPGCEILINGPFHEISRNTVPWRNSKAQHAKIHKYAKISLATAHLLESRRKLQIAGLNGSGRTSNDIQNACRPLRGLPPPPLQAPSGPACILGVIEVRPSRFLLNLPWKASSPHKPVPHPATPGPKINFFFWCQNKLFDTADLKVETDF